MAPTPSLGIPGITPAEVRPARKKRITGWARFGLFLVFIPLVVLSLSTGITAVGTFVIVISIALDSANSISSVGIGLAGAVFSTLLAIGVIWGTTSLYQRLSVGNPPDPKRGNPFACQLCLAEAPNIRAHLNRHIGMIVLMNHTSLKARFCKSCFVSKFWDYTLKTLFLGWWGLISCLITPMVLLVNLSGLCRTFRLAPKPPTAIPPTLDVEGVRRLEPHTRSIAERLLAGDNEEDVALDLASATGLTPAQAYLFVRPIADAPAAVLPPPLPVR